MPLIQYSARTGQELIWYVKSLPFVVSVYCYYLQCNSFCENIKQSLWSKPGRHLRTNNQHEAKEKRIRENKRSSVGYYEQNTGHSNGLPSTISLMLPIEKSYQGANIYTECRS
jgi:hypothetical protein